MLSNEKEHQVNASELVSFGIPIHSRYARATELSEMLMFTNEVARLKLTHCVKGVFYDSKACLCIIDLHNENAWHTEPSIQIRLCAENTISQFQWDGATYHSHNQIKEMKSY